MKRRKTRSGLKAGRVLPSCLDGCQALCAQSQLPKAPGYFLTP